QNPAQNILVGASGQRASGIGIWAAYDTRDNPNAPRSGTFLRYAGRIFREFLGSDYEYSLQSYEARQYIPVSEGSVLAFSSYLRITDGATPFRDLSTPDGVYTFRGIEKGRYRNRHLLTLQSEYRFLIHKKIGLAVFAEAAQVVSKLGDLSANEFKSSFGGGFRYTLNKEQRFNLRIDTNWVDGTFGLTINVREAF
ncbi:MAG: BamA/TamA family outer membrane protein, partial [Candidatus Latescibacteria bacterium]|nr:BamA/TamA family outer membrane protein [Candidatus Latescibacterota bacterium]